MIIFCSSQIKIIWWPGRSGSRQNKLYGDMAQPAPPKKIIWWHWPAGSAEKNYMVALASRPSTRIPSQNGGTLRFPLWGTCQKIIWRPRWKNYMAASGLIAQKKIIWWHWPARPSEKNYMVALAAGWNSDMSPYNHFFGEKLYIFNFCQEQDALPPRWGGTFPWTRGPSGWWAP